MTCGRGVEIEELKVKSAELKRKTGECFGWSL